MSNFTLDMSKFLKAVKESPEAVGRGAKRALGDIKDDWVRGAVDIAPVDTTNLREQIRGEVGESGSSSFVEVEANATQESKSGRFNYAVYIHEYDAGGKILRTPGTEKKFLDVSLEQREDEYQQWLEEEVEAELKKAGW